MMEAVKDLSEEEFLRLAWEIYQMGVKHERFKPYHMESEQKAYMKCRIEQWLEIDDE